MNGTKEWHIPWWLMVLYIIMIDYNVLYIYIYMIYDWYYYDYIYIYSMYWYPPMLTHGVSIGLLIYWWWKMWYGIILGLQMADITDGMFTNDMLLMDTNGMLLMVKYKTDTSKFQWLNSWHLMAVDMFLGCIDPRDLTIDRGHGTGIISRICHGHLWWKSCMAFSQRDVDIS